MNVYGKLIKAQLEDSASDLIPVSTGLVYFNSSTSFIKFYNSSAWKTVVDSDSIQTITNKYTPILRGSPDPFQPMDLRSTDDPNKYQVLIRDGSSLGIGPPNDLGSDLYLGTNEVYMLNVNGNYARPTAAFSFVDDIHVVRLLESNAVNVGGFINAKFVARTAGVLPGDIVLVFDGVKTIKQVVDAWNLANPSNPVDVYNVLNSNIPTAQTFTMLAADPLPVFPGVDLEMTAGRGNYYTPSLLKTNDRLFRIGSATAAGFGTVNHAYTFGGSMRLIATEDHVASTAYGTAWIFATVDTGTTTANARFRIDNSGIQALGTHFKDNTFAGLKFLISDVNKNIVEATFNPVKGYATTWTTGMGMTSVLFTHNLSSTDVDVSLIDLSDNTEIGIDTVVVSGANTVTLSASEAPSVSGWRVIVQAN